MNLKEAWAFIDREEEQIIKYLEDRGWQEVEFDDSEWVAAELVHRFARIGQHPTESTTVDVDYRLNWELKEDDEVISEGQGLSSLKKLRGAYWQKESK
jgi:hypothetical protein